MARFAPKVGKGATTRRAAARRVALALVAAALAPGAAAADPAPLRIGVAYLPSAAAAPEARLYTDAGFERDLGKAIGRRLGRSVVFEAVSDPAQALTDGRIDLALARLPEDAAPPAPLAAIDTGYASPLGLSMRTDTDIRAWGDLAGRRVCVAEGDAEARRLAEAAGARVRTERAPARALMQVRTGDCDAALHDAVLLEALFQDPRWRKFSAGLPPRSPSRLTALAGPGLAAGIRAALNDLQDWPARRARWARNVAFEVYLDQEAPDCH